ncbi:MAG: flagellin, partial [Trichlorobacter sp.]|uniref:flagellin n=1 Tax=Trichlorobacter sp. TaxID=2911007 RepID=UPI0025682D31
RIANATDFNGIYLLNGNLASDTFDGTGVNSTGKLKVHFGTGNDSACDYYYIQIGCCTADNLIGASASAEAKFVAANDLTLQETGNWGGLPLGLHNIPTNVQAQFNPTDMYRLYFNPAYTIWYAIGKDKHNNMHALKFDINTQNYVSDQIIPQFGLCISTQALAASALSAINTAIVSKDKIRANLGAMQNRLENTISNLQIQSANLQAAESQISDTDVAQEMTAFVKNQILSQSATAMLAQANSLPKIALQLITG